MTLKRMGQLLKVVRAMPNGKGLAEAQPRCDLKREANAILNDLEQDPQVAEKKPSITRAFSALHVDAKISDVAFYRILENLVRNAVEAEAKNITVALKNI